MNAFRFSRRGGNLALLLLAVGALSWSVVLAVVLLLTDDPAPERESATEAIGPQPTLAAIVSTASPTTPPAPSATLTPESTPTPLPASLTAAPTMEPSPTPLPEQDTPGVTASVPAQDAAAPAAAAAAPTACAPPDGWERYTVQPDDTLFAFVLGAGGPLTVDDLMAANCLSSRYLSVDQVIFLPPGAADNAPPSVSLPPGGSGTGWGAAGPRPPACPCTISVAEGWRREQIAEAINASQTLFTAADFLAATGPGASAPFDFVAERPAGTSLEGFLFPGTYTAQNDTTAEAFRDMLLGAFAANVAPQVRADAAAQGTTFYQALIIASVVQREVRGPETQKLVASVYLNRFRDGNRLGTTVAVQYALGGPGNWWPRVTASGLQVDSPYNTYTRSGLPPTPIDSPGLSAILGTVYAPRTEYRYHTAACDGSGEAFAATYEEHLANVNCE